MTCLPQEFDGCPCRWTSHHGVKDKGGQFRFVKFRRLGAYRGLGRRLAGHGPHAVVRP